MELEASLLGLLEEPLKPPVSDEPVTRVVVFMEWGGEPGEPLPPGASPVVDVGPG